MQSFPLTFLHGFMGHPTDWDPVRAQLNMHPTQALTQVATESWSASLASLAETIPESSILIGYSMGARLALGLALEYPQRYRGLVFLSGNPGLESAADRATRRVADLCIADEIQVGLHESLEGFLNHWYQSDVFASMSAEQRAAEIVRKLSQTPKEIQQWPSIMRANSISEQPNYWPRLSSLEIPMLAVAGELDPKYRSIINQIGAEAPQITTHIVPDSGHMVHRENPSHLCDLIRDWKPR